MLSEKEQLRDISSIGQLHSSPILFLFTCTWQKRHNHSDDDNWGLPHNIVQIFFQWWKFVLCYVALRSYHHHHCRFILHLAVFDVKKFTEFFTEKYGLSCSVHHLTIQASKWVRFVRKSSWIGCTVHSMAAAACLHQRQATCYDDHDDIIWWLMRCDIVVQWSQHQQIAVIDHLGHHVNTSTCVSVTKQYHLVLVKVLTRSYIPASRPNICQALLKLRSAM